MPLHINVMVTNDPLKYYHSKVNGHTSTYTFSSLIDSHFNGILMIKIIFHGFDGEH